jgi:hypothetical protein
MKTLVVFLSLAKKLARRIATWRRAIMTDYCCQFYFLIFSVVYIGANSAIAYMSYACAIDARPAIWSALVLLSMHILGAWMYAALVRV